MRLNFTFLIARWTLQTRPPYTNQDTVQSAIKLATASCSSCQK